MTLTPTWPASAAIRACVTERAGGVSLNDYASLNLGLHVGDDPSAVARNRASLVETLGLPSEPAWLNQVHGTTVLDLDAVAIRDGSARATPPLADAAITRTPGKVCCVMTADCLPIFLCDRDATVVGLAHAGWRGLAAGVVPATVGAMGGDPAELLAWLGPAISAAAFEVGSEVREAFLSADQGADSAFSENQRGRWQADLYTLATRALKAAGVSAVYGGGRCTFTENARFFSHRRVAPCGRMASLIWIAEHASTDR